MSSYRLTEALVTDPRLERLYGSSPEFRAGIEQLVRMLPRWVQLMADDAEALDERRRLMVDEIRMAPPAPWAPRFPIPQRD